LKEVGQPLCPTSLDHFALYGVKDAPNPDRRFAASKYKRKPTALLCPPQNAPAPFVPIRVNTLTDKISIAPLKGVAENELKATALSKALLALRVMR
jgi:hypothetical protein